MAGRPAILGWPVSLAIRGMPLVKSGITAIGGMSTTAKAAAATTAIAAGAAVVAPWITGVLSDSPPEAPTGDASQSSSNPLMDSIDMMSGLLTMIDMNAEVVNISEKRRIAMVSVPGRESDFIQDLGGHSVWYRIRGRFYDTDPKYMSIQGIMQTILKTTIGSSAVGSTQMLRLLMRTAAPVPFMCEHDVAMVVMTDFDFSMIGGEPNWVRYNMELVEIYRIPYLAKMAILGTGNLFGRWGNA